MLNTPWDVKRLFALVAMSTLLLSVAVRAQEQSSAAFTSKEGAFSVVLPKTPKEKSEDISSNNGPTTLHTFVAESSDGQEFFLVGYSDYENKLDTNASLEGVINAQVISMKGKITTDKTETLDGHPGRSVTIESEDAVFLSKVYVAGNRLYQIMYGVPKGTAPQAHAKEFFDSFRILM